MLYQNERVDSYSWMAEVRGKPFYFQGGGVCGFKNIILQAYLPKQTKIHAARDHY